MTFSVSILRCSASGSGLATCTSDAPAASTASSPSTRSPGPVHGALESTRSFALKPLVEAEFSQSASTSSTDRPAKAGPGWRSATIWSPCTRTAVA